MPSFIAIESKNQINLSADWTDSAKFNSEKRIVDNKGKKVSADYKGRRYRLISKKERTFSTPERIARGFLGVIAVIVTIGIALFFKTIRNLFTKDKAKVRYGVAVPPKPLIPENPRIDIEKEASRFFFKEDEQDIAQAINQLVDNDTHKYMTTHTIYGQLQKSMKNKGYSFISTQALTHPKLKNWIMKGGGDLRWSWITNDAGTSNPNKFDHIMRVFMAERMAKVVDEEKLDIVIPEKRLHLSKLPSKPGELHEKYYVFAKKIAILSDDDTITALRELPEDRQRKVARDICILIKRTGFMDAHLGNIRWSAEANKIAIIDTESQGLLIEKNDPSPRTVASVGKCAKIGLQELKNRVGKYIKVFAEEADIALANMPLLC